MYDYILNVSPSDFVTPPVASQAWLPTLLDRFRGDNPEGMRSPARELGGDKPPMTGNGNHLSKWWPFMEKPWFYDLQMIYELVIINGLWWLPCLLIPIVKTFPVHWSWLGNGLCLFYHILPTLMEKPRCFSPDVHWGWPAPVRGRQTDGVRGCQRAQSSQILQRKQPNVVSPLINQYKPDTSKLNQINPCKPMNQPILP